MLWAFLFGAGPIVNFGKLSNLAASAGATVLKLCCDCAALLVQFFSAVAPVVLFTAVAELVLVELCWCCAGGFLIFPCGFCFATLFLLLFPTAIAKSSLLSLTASVAIP